MQSEPLILKATDLRSADYGWRGKLGNIVTIRLQITQVADNPCIAADSQEVAQFREPIDTPPGTECLSACTTGRLAHRLCARKPYWATRWPYILGIRTQWAIASRRPQWTQLSTVAGALRSILSRL